MALVCGLSFALTCDVCYEITKANGNLNIPVGLTPTNTYYLFVIDWYGNIYRQQVTINGDGSFDIDPTQYADGIFKVARTFQMFLATDLNGTIVVSFTRNTISYKCIKLTVQSCF